MFFLSRFPNKSENRHQGVRSIYGTADFPVELRFSVRGE
jgi:hypothetical protein